MARPHPDHQEAIQTPVGNDGGFRAFVRVGITETSTITMTIPRSTFEAMETKERPATSQIAVRAYNSKLCPNSPHMSANKPSGAPSKASAKTGKPAAHSDKTVSQTQAEVNKTIFPATAGETVVHPSPRLSYSLGKDSSDIEVLNFLDDGWIGKAFLVRLEGDRWGLEFHAKLTHGFDSAVPNDVLAERLRHVQQFTTPGSQIRCVQKNNMASGMLRFQADLGARKSWNEKTLLEAAAKTFATAGVRLVLPQ